MGESLVAPTLQRALNSLAQRVDALERRVRATATTDTAWEIIFSYAGTLTATESPPALIPRGGVLAVLAVAFKVGSAGSTDTVIDVLRDGTTVATVTVPASDETFNAEVGVSYSVEQTISLAVTTAGTGAADMTAEARFT